MFVVIMRVMLVILDGWGLGKDVVHSAVAHASTPFVDRCWAEHPHSALIASGPSVGLPDGQMGNSEVGHTHIGAGRVVDQMLLRLHKEVETGQFYRHRSLLQFFAEVRARGARVHLMGLLSEGGVHAHTQHLEALCKFAQQEEVNKVYVHAFLDGRDMPPASAAGLLQRLEPKIAAYGAKLTSCTGRYYAMDRNQRWERTKIAYDALVTGQGVGYTHLQEAIHKAYAAGVTDEFLLPHVRLGADGKPLATLRPHDYVICFNFRPDRMCQLVQLLTGEKTRTDCLSPPPLHFATMTRYYPYQKEVRVLYKNQVLVNTLGAVLEQANKRQLRVAETEKYPHVTYFFSGGQHTPFHGEERLMCPSPTVATYDLQPEMAAATLTEHLITHLPTQQHDFICLNYANPDMVGHTGVFDATVRACSFVDNCLQKVAHAARKANYHVLIIADHGNAECMRLPNGSPHTAHTTNPVPCILLQPKDKRMLTLRNGTLVDVAPTVLKLMELPQPKEMTGTALYG